VEARMVVFVRASRTMHHSAQRRQWVEFRHSDRRCFKYTASSTWAGMSTSPRITTIPSPTQARVDVQGVQPLMRR
jgi:hypothetical protein